MNSNPLFNKVQRSIRSEQMICPGETVLAAVSGGADSMCLLHLLSELSKCSGFQVEAATMDHNIRPESGQDVEFVRRWCARWGIPCHTGSADVPSLAAARGAGLEETARELRYAFLQETADRIGAAKIATAHNADDNAETILLHLIRGSGLKGLGGIPPVRGRLIRPLLWVTRAEIESYCRERPIEFVQDSTNFDTTYRRNYIRHKVLPLLKAQNPNLLTTLNRTAKGLRSDSAYLEQQARQITEGAVRKGQQISFSAGTLAALPEALSSRVIQQLAAQLVPDTVLSSAQRDSVLCLCRGTRPGAVCSLPGALMARREYERLVLSVESARAAEPPATLSPGGTLCYAGRVLRCERAVCPEGKFNRPEEYYLKPVACLLLRGRKTGDEITLPNRPNKTVKKLLIDSKIPRRLRQQTIVLEAEGRVAALDGFGTDVRFLPKPGDPCWKITSTAVCAPEQPMDNKGVSQQ